jgi:hypothetical protein
MVPQVSRLHGFDLSRSGDWLAVSFFDEADIFHSLEFDERRFQHPDGRTEFLGWDLALTAYPRWLEAGVECTPEPRAVTWADATRLLGLLAPLMGDETSGERILAEMIQVANSEGAPRLHVG